MLHKTTIRRLIAVGFVVGALAAVAPATSLAGEVGGGGPAPSLGQTR